MNSSDVKFFVPKPEILEFYGLSGKGLPMYYQMKYQVMNNLPSKFKIVFKDAKNDCSPIDFTEPTTYMEVDCENGGSVVEVETGWLITNAVKNEVTIELQ